MNNKFNLLYEEIKKKFAFKIFDKETNTYLDYDKTHFYIHPDGRVMLEQPDMTYSDISNNPRYIIKFINN